MNTSLLTSGELNRYTAIGEDGVTVWQFADAFRNSIEHSLKLGKSCADILAIPKVSSDLKLISWYIPFDSAKAEGYDIVNWTCAGYDEKKAALKTLKDFELKASDLGYELSATALSGNDRLFAHFLTGKNDGVYLPAFHFPSAENLFIVDGKPVITFWGFKKSGDAIKGSPFEVLDSLKDPADAVQTEKTTSFESRTFFSRFWWLLPLLLLLLLVLSYLLWNRYFKTDLVVRGNTSDTSLKVDEHALGKTELSDEHLGNFVKNTDGAAYHVSTNGTGIWRKNASDDLLVTDNGRVLVTDPKVGGDLQNGKKNPLQTTEDLLADKGIKDHAPDLVDTEKSSSDAENKDGSYRNEQDKGNDTEPNQQKADLQSPPVNTDTPNARSGHNGLKLSSDDLQSHNFKQLDGTWQVRSSIVDSKTNLPLNLEYNFKDGKGVATVVTKDGNKCQGAVQGQVRGGALRIDNESATSCADGSSYNLPAVVCKPGKDGLAECVSSYSGSNGGSKNTFPMQLTK